MRYLQETEFWRGQAHMQRVVGFFIRATALNNGKTLQRGRNQRVTMEPASHEGEAEQRRAAGEVQLAIDKADGVEVDLGQVHGGEGERAPGLPRHALLPAEARRERAGAAPRQGLAHPEIDVGMDLPGPGLAVGLGVAVLPAAEGADDALHEIGVDLEQAQRRGRRVVTVDEEVVHEEKEGLVAAADADGGGGSPEVAPAAGKAGHLHGLVRGQEGQHVTNELVQQGGERIAAKAHRRGGCWLRCVGNREGRL